MALLALGSTSARVELMRHPSSAAAARVTPYPTHQGGSRAARGCAVRCCSRPIYEGVALDMDGTLTLGEIDFVKMRQDTTITEGDLFTVMESWSDPAEVERSMGVILQLEDEAEQTLKLMTGLQELLTYLTEQDVRIALVTRNTPKAVAAFLKLLGPAFESAFTSLITRHDQYVKPDYRLLRDLAEEWGIPEDRMLMVGDSGEDIECGNAAGTATCFIQGGGNEVAGAGAPPLPGAVPTFSVSGLPELLDRLRSGDTQLGLGRPGEGSASESDSEEVAQPGAAPPGVAFLDAMYAEGHIATAQCSFPRMGAAAGGFMASTHWGDRLLHVGCGAGGLTKLMSSQGLEVIGCDVEVRVAQRRGLNVCGYPSGAAPLSSQSLQAALATGPSVAPQGNGGAGLGEYDVVVVYQTGSSASEETLRRQLSTSEGSEEVHRVLKAGGRLCLQGPVGGMREELLTALSAAGFDLTVCEDVVLGAESHLRLVATKRG